MAERSSFTPPAPRIEPTPRWVRVRAAGEWIADSRGAMLLVWFGPGRLPTYCIPAQDVRTDLLRPSSADPAGPLIPHDVLVGDKVLDGAARLIGADPALSAVRDHWTFTWDDRVEWFEESLQVRVHARDPMKRVDAMPSERHVRVEIGGVTLAESRRPLALFETDLPTRWYLPVADVRSDLLEPSPTVSSCPYKGTARYWSARVGDQLHRDVAWTYPESVAECPRIAGLTAFFNERVDLVVDGVPQERPLTAWS